MAVFSVNQATQFYVGDVAKKTNGTDVYYTVGTEVTDRIKKDHVLSTTVVKVSEMDAYAPAPVITVTNPVKGAEYLIRLTISTEAGPQYAYIKSVAVKAADSNATNVAEQIIEALNKASRRDIANTYYKAVAGGVGGQVKITPEPEHIVGKKFTVPVISVAVTEITGNVDASVEGWIPTEPVAAVAIDGTGLAKLHDLEYFCAGEKGDIYRGAMWPNEIPFVSKLDKAGVTKDWYVHTIHYYETLDNEATQKSEKTIVIVTDAETISE